MESESVLWRLLKAAVGGAGAALLLSFLIIGISLAKEYFFGSKNKK